MWEPVTDCHVRRRRCSHHDANGGAKPFRLRPGETNPFRLRPGETNPFRLRPGETLLVVRQEPPEVLESSSQEAFGITIGDDMSVARVEKDSIAYAAGVRCKNMILEVNGVPCYNSKVVVAMIRQQGVFRLCLHRKPEVMRSSPSKTTNVWMRRFSRFCRRHRPL